jgi:hypothetical protein
VYRLRFPDGDFRMRQRTRYLRPLMLIPLGVCAIAPAQQASDPLEACYQLADSAAQLTCFRQEMQRRHALTAQQATTTAPAPAPAAAPSSAATQTFTPTPRSAAIAPAARPQGDDTVGLDGRQLSIKRKQEGIEAPTIKPIVAGLTELKQRPGHQYYFELDNGQVWESTDAQSDLFLGPHESVTIRPGFLGAFFLRTQEGNSIRVHRLR